MRISIIVMILQVWQLYRWRIHPSCIKRKTRKNNEKILILCGSSWSFKSSIVLIERHPGFYMILLVSSICQLQCLITLSRIIYICITVTQKGKLFLLLTQYRIVRWRDGPTQIYKKNTRVLVFIRSYLLNALFGKQFVFEQSCLLQIF